MKVMRFLPAILAGLFIPAAALAVDQYPPILCNGLFGCGAAPENVLLNNALPTAGGLLIQVAGAGAVIAIVLAGVQMLLSYADEGKISSAKKAVMYALGGLGIALAASSLVSFVVTENYVQSGGDLLVGSGGILANALRIIMMLFDVGFIIVIILAGYRMIMAFGNADEFKKGGDIIKWAITGAVIVNLARALVQAFLALNL